MATRGSKSISRIDSKKAKGWYVRVKFNKQNHIKFFSDSVHGGESSALEAAILWRNKKENELGKPRTVRIVIASFQGNNTGFTGVTRTKKWTGARDKDGIPTPRYSDLYTVTWSPEPGAARRTSFSVDKNGEEEARRRAIDLRKRMERQIYGQEIDLHKSISGTRNKKSQSSHSDNQDSSRSFQTI